MILQTILPLELVLHQEDTEPVARVKRIGDIQAEVTETPQGTQVRRLLSTNPMDYLNPRLSPGSRV